jgi:hypothetical protein
MERVLLRRGRSKLSPMDAEQSAQGNRDDREERRSGFPSEPELAQIRKEINPAMEAIRIMVENLRTYLLWRK